MNQHLRLNGLIAGKIPAYTPCPFIGKCVVENSNCPTKDSTKSTDFDCPTARTQSLIIEKFK